MARNLGPKHKKCRRYGVKLCDSPKCPVVARNYPPGMHGAKGRGKLTGYGEQLAQKQMAKEVYGVFEKQFKKYYEKAMRQKGDVGENLLQQLEMRLDNIVYRLGFAVSRRQARQMTGHGLFLVNDRRVDIPSYQVKIGDSVKLKEQVKKSRLFENIEEKIKQQEMPSWLSLDENSLTGKVLDKPKLDEISSVFDVKTIIEFYSK